MERIRLSGSVGIKGKNVAADIKNIQKALNAIITSLPSISRLIEDGSLGSKPENSKTVAAIIAFQKIIVKMVRPDGLIEPQGRTLQCLNDLIQKSNSRPAIAGLKFPLSERPTQSYKVSPRAFGSTRTATRKHAGCDLIADAGTPIYAMSSGVITHHGEFYYGSWELVVDHGSFVARYGEVSDTLADGLGVGSQVTRGQHIGNVGVVNLPSGKKLSMLHLEMYRGSASGSLTNRTNLPYQRRSDLLDPTTYLDGAEG